MDSFSHLSDEELVKTCTEDMRFFAELIRRYEKKLLTYISRRSHASPDDKKDILQNIFIKVYKNINAFDPELSFSSWIYRISHNEIIDWYRKEKVRPWISFDENEEIIEKIASEDDVFKVVNRKDLASAVRTAVERLPEKYRDIIALRFFEEKNYEEISDILMIPPGTVATQIHRLKKQLQELLKEYEHSQ